MFSRNVFFVAASFLAGSALSAELSDEHIEEVRAGFEERRDRVLQRMVDDPYPGPGSFLWNRLNFALSALHLDVRREDANEAIVAARNFLWENPGEFFDMHWSGNHWVRIYEYFHEGSRYYPGRLTPEAETAIAEVLWRWTRSQSRLEDADPKNTWHLWMSENHDAMRKATSWGAAMILRRLPDYRDLLYDDGSTAVEQYEAWTAYLSECLRERGRRGLLVEISSNTYSKYTVQCWYNFYDFAEDPVFRHLAESILHLWWADWAVEQIDGIRGGSRARMARNTDRLGSRDGISDLASYYLGIGPSPTIAPAAMALATSKYRLPDVIMDLALDREGTGAFEYFSRRPGLELIRDHWDLTRVYVLDPDYGGILRYAYVTPDFIMGTSMLEKRPEDHWARISSQNRWHGVVFRGHPDSRIFPQGTALGEHDLGYNEQWSVQRKGTLIAQKLTTHRNIGAMRVYFGSSLSRVEEDGWVFVSAPHAYAAVRPAYGGYTWDDSRWMRLNNEYSPVILEVVRHSDFDSFEEFRDAVKGAPISHSQGVLTYTGLLDHGTFTFYTAASTPPRINGVPVDFAPPKTFDSPYLESEWASGLVRVHKGSRAKVLDFNFEPPPLTLPTVDAEFVSEAEPDRSSEAEPELLVSGAPGGRKHPYLRFDLSEVSQETDLIEAELTIDGAAVEEIDYLQSGAVEIWGLTAGDWDGGALAWNNAPAHHEEGIDPEKATLLGRAWIPDAARGIFRDEFVRSEVGPAWTTARGLVGINQFDFSLRALEDNSLAYFNEVETAGDFTVEATLYFGLNVWSGVVFNHDEDGDDFYWFRVRPGRIGTNKSAGQILKYVDGELVAEWDTVAPSQEYLSLQGKPYRLRARSSEPGVFVLSLLDGETDLFGPEGHTVIDDDVTPPLSGGHGGVFFRTAVSVGRFWLGSPGGATGVMDLQFGPEVEGSLIEFLSERAGQAATLLLARADAGGERLRFERTSPALRLRARAWSRPVASVEAIPGGGDGSAGVFRLWLDRPAPADMELYWIFGGNAEPGIDYEPLPRNVLVPAGESEAILFVEGLEAPGDAPRSLSVFVADHPAYLRNPIAARATLFLRGEPWDAWRHHHFTAAEREDPEVGGASAFPAGDRVPNLVKFMLDLDPWIPVSAAVPLPEEVGEALELTFWRRRDSGAVSLHVEMSDDLIIWRSGEPYLEEVIVEVAGDLEKVRVRDRMDSGDPRRRFYRLVVDAQPDG